MSVKTSQEQELERATQKVERFVRRFEPSYRMLAYHAALPLVLTPELVNYLRVEFLRGEVPWVAEVDLLLSDLCRQVGYELYAMEADVRSYLLKEMKRELGEERMQEVAKRLIGYVKYLHQTNPYISSQELQAQQWAAMVYLEEPRQQAVKEIAEAFQQRLVNKAELARLARITQELAPQLKAYGNLVDYAALVSRVLTNATKVKRKELERTYQVLPGVKLRVHNELLLDNSNVQTTVLASPFGHRGFITNPRDFFDREELLQRIFEILANEGNVLLVGEPGVGKSLLLHQVCAQGEEYLHSRGKLDRKIVYLNLQLVVNEDEFYQALCDVLEIPLSRGYQLTRALRNRHYVLCLDEIEKLTEPAFTDTVQSLLRGLAQGRNSPLKLVIASHFPLEVLFPDSPTSASPLSNILTLVNVEPFSEEVTRAFLRDYLEGTEVEFNEQQISQLFAETQGHLGQLQQGADKLYRQIIASRTDGVKLSPELKVFEFEVVTVNNQGQIVQREQRQARYFTEDLGNGVTLELVAIPGGTFMMGAPENEEGSEGSERPQHQVTIKPFFMGKYPVTQAQWQVVAALPQVNSFLSPNPSRFKQADRPVEQVSWYDAMEFCARLSKHTGREYRLPSEAQWEYACRAGTTTPFHYGETITTELANYDGNRAYGNSIKGKYREETTVVGGFPANAFGLYDMHGNVWEWCADSWHENYEGAPRDGSAWLENNNNDNQLRQVRGGSWYYHPVHCRSACRYNRLLGDRRHDNIGFRVVCAAAWTL